MPVNIIRSAVLGLSAHPAMTFSDVASIDESETDADGHWLFNKNSSANLTGLKGGALTSLGTAPTHSAAHLQCASGIANRLATTFADRDKFTITGVLKVPAAGTQTSVAANLESGVGGYDFNTQLSTSYELFSGLVLVTTATNKSNNITNFTTDEYRFFAFGIDHSGASRLRRHSIGSATYDHTDTTLYTPHPSRKIALGGLGAAILAEGVVYLDRLLTPDEMYVKYLRAKARLLRQSGLTVV